MQCKKKPFKSRPEAMKTLTRLRKFAKKGRPVTVVKVYKCQICKNWHLTSNRYFKPKKKLVVIRCKGGESLKLLQ